MTTLKIIMFFVGVLIVLAGLSLIMTTRFEMAKTSGQDLGPEGWAALIDAIARFWTQIISGVGQEYGIGITVLAVGVIVMALPLALPKASKR